MESEGRFTDSGNQYPGSANDQKNAAEEFKDGGYGYGGSTYVSYYEEGSLVIDIVDWQEKELSFRGVATGTLSKSEKTPEESQADIDELVINILSKFPPGQGNK